MAPCFLLHLKLFTLHLLAGHHGCFSSPVPRFLRFFFSLLLLAGHHGCFSSPVPRSLSFFFSLPLPAGHHDFFSSPVPRSLGFFFSLYLLAGHHDLFSSPVPRLRKFFLLSSSYDQNPVTRLDLISRHTIGLPEGCHRHIIPLSDIPQTVTLPHYINSQ